MIQVNLDFADDNFREMLRQEIKNALADVIQQNQLFNDSGALRRHQKK
ncbi:hypothetical protein [Peribacillus sp. N1]